MVPHVFEYASLSLFARESVFKVSNKVGQQASSIASEEYYSSKITEFESRHAHAITKTCPYDIQ